VWAASWVVPWMRTPVPPRYWRKPVAAIQGVVLTAAAANSLPGVAINVVIAVSMVLLAESFGRDVLWQWRRQRVLRPEAKLRASRIRRRRGGDEERRRPSSAIEDEGGGFPSRCASSERLVEPPVAAPSAV